MASFLGAIAVLLLFVAGFWLLAVVASRLGGDAMPSAPRRERWERGR